MQQNNVMEIVIKSDNSDGCENCGQAERRGNWTAGPDTVPTQCDTGAGKAQGDS